MSAAPHHIPSNLTVSSDQLKLDLVFVYEYLKNSYWAKGRSFADMEKSIKNSICFGLYLDRQQIGFARALSDMTVFAYLMDVFIIDEFKGLGYGSFLMEEVLNSPEIKGVESLRLATNDAHDFYRKKGFKSIEKPEKLMEKLK